VLPGRRFMRYVPYLGKAMTIAALLSASANPAQALADELDVSPDVVQAWFDGQAVLSLDAFWPGGGSEVDSGEFIDGGFLSVGDQLWVWKPNPQKNASGQLILDAEGNAQPDGTYEWLRYRTVKKIITSTDHGVFDVEFEEEDMKGLRIQKMRTPAAPVPTGPVTGRN